MSILIGIVLYLHYVDVPCVVFETHLLESNGDLLPVRSGEGVELKRVLPHLQFLDAPSSGSWLVNLSHKRARVGCISMLVRHSANVGGLIITHDTDDTTKYC